MQKNSPELWRVSICGKQGAAHKNEYGHLAVLGGAEMTGAASLASISALRMGAGLVSIFSVPQVANVYRGVCPSLIVREIENYSALAESLTGKHNAVLIGPGAGMAERVGLRKCILNVLNLGRVTVLDADALNVFEGQAGQLFENLHEKCVLTPHAGEFARLFPDIKGNHEEQAKAAAARAGCVIVLKGQQTVIAGADGKCVVNDNGTPWLASAGTGDVLAGMIAGLAANQEIPVFDAACAAVWFHGRAAEIFGAGLISSDLPAILPKVWQEFLN